MAEIRLGLRAKLRLSVIMLSCDSAVLNNYYQYDC